MDTRNNVRDIGAEMLFREGQQYQDHHAFEKALESYQRAAALDPNHASAFFRMGVVLSKLGRWSEAANAYLQSIQLRPEYGEAHLNLGFVYYEMGQDRQAEEAFETARRLGGLADPAGKMRT